MVLAALYFRGADDGLPGDPAFKVFVENDKEKPQGCESVGDSTGRHYGLDDDMSQLTDLTCFKTNHTPSDKIRRSYTNTRRAIRITARI